MNVSAPYEAVASTLDVAIAVELSRLPEPVTVSRLRSLLPSGSDRGVRLALGRLVGQGLVSAREYGRVTVYALNHEHLAAPAVRSLAEMRARMLDQLRGLIETWEAAPYHASLFGSAARRDGDVDSDIDILVVRPERVAEDDPVWRAQIELLEDRVLAWTGNRVELAELSFEELGDLRVRTPAIVHNLKRDGIDLAGVSVRQLFDGDRR